SGMAGYTGRGVGMGTPVRIARFFAVVVQLGCVVSCRATRPTTSRASVIGVSAVPTTTQTVAPRRDWDADLLAAIERVDVEAAGAALRAGARVNRKPGEDPPLAFAAIKQSPELVL